MSRALLALVLLAGCQPKVELTPPPPPLRPEAEPQETTRAHVATDCTPLRPEEELKPIPFDQRSIPEGHRLVSEAQTTLRLAEGAEVERRLREQYTAEAVVKLITALQADPYNVQATYTLAATYARIGRKQCSMNLLTRLLQMRPHQSKHGEIEASLDRLLGRRQNSLDPNFAEMRRDDRFRELIKKMCEGTKDPNCVFGAQRQ